MNKVNSIKITSSIITLLQISVLLFVANNFLKANIQSDDTVLAEIKNKTITVKDFKQRSELTIKPKNFRDKQTILNNLIIEKLMAFEAKDNLDLKNNPKFVSQIKGIKEQLMRDKLFESISNKVKIDSNNLFKAYELSSRAYQVEFYTIYSKEIANNIVDYLQVNPDSSENVYSYLKNEVGKQPEHIIKFDDQETDEIHDALFTDFIPLGSSIGPIRLANNSFIIMKILDWIDYPVIGFEEKNKRFKEVEKKLKQKESLKQWHSFQKEVMSGKEILFEKDTFQKLSTIAFANYNLNDDTLNTTLPSISLTMDEIADDKSFFSISGDVWSVSDFKKALSSHPLVFRSKNITENNFMTEFKAAVINLITNHFLTKEAYKAGLDKLDEVEQTVENWEDAFVALYHGRQYLQKSEENNLFDTKSVSAKQKYWENYIKKVSNKYSTDVKINYNVLKNVDITNIEYFILRPGVPYPVPVPSFPTFTNSKEIEFGGKINTVN